MSKYETSHNLVNACTKHGVAIARVHVPTIDQFGLSPSFHRCDDKLLHICALQDSISCNAM